MIDRRTFENLKLSSSDVTRFKMVCIFDMFAILLTLTLEFFSKYSHYFHIYLIFRRFTFYFMFNIYYP